MLLTDRPFRTLLSREILRFTRVWMQTLVPPLLTSLLYLVVFGVALGSRIREVDGVPYLEYILPGIAFMSLITGSHMNSSWSVFDAKRERYIEGPRDGGRGLRGGCTVRRVDRRSSWAPTPDSGALLLHLRLPWDDGRRCGD